MSNLAIKPDLTFKILIVGESGVGKSCMLLRFAEDTFSECFVASLGVDFKFRTVKIEDLNVRLQIWDTAGQERFKTITNSFYRGAHGVVIAYDVTDEHSFCKVREWVNSTKKHSSESIPIVLVGNKCDLTQKRVIDTQIGKDLAQNCGLMYTETSAKSGIGIDNLFINLLGKIMLEQFRNRKIEPQPSLPPPTTHTGCC